jgi:predicted DNA-binding transcriptional regulator YafY
MANDPSPTARALLALELIQGQPGITSERLAAKLDVSDRAARRYVAILREAGIPIDSVRGPYGGYRVGRGLRLPPLVFTATEALGLVMAVLDGHHDAGDPTDPVGSALGKIMRALPQPVAAQAEAVRRRTAPAPDRSAARPDPETVSVLVQACADSRLVRIDYRTEAGTEWSMPVEPWAVVVRHGRWYLLCHSPRAGARRAYRVDRIRGAEVLEDAFTPPPELDPVSELEEHLAVGWEYEIEITVDAPVDAIRPYLPRVLGHLQPVDTGTTRLHGSTSNLAWYAEQLAGLPASFRIVQSPELAEAVEHVGRRLLAATGHDAARPVDGHAGRDGSASP